jgi:SAM-dependent methyltransferase
MSERDWEWCDRYSRIEVQRLYAAFATCAILREMRELYASFVASEVRAGEDTVLLELGIGPGHQLEHLLSQAINWPVASLKVVGVDVCSAYLLEAAKRVERAAARLPFSVTFHGVNSSFADLEAARLPYRPTIAAATLALHHLTWAQKERFFREAARWGMRGFFIGEVDSLVDHRPGEADTGPETGRALYQSVFRAVQEEAGLEPAAAAEINRSFFEPEMRRIVSGSYQNRGEYYVPEGEWRRWLAGSGFARIEARETFRSADGGYRLVAISGRRQEQGGR